MNVILVAGGIAVTIAGTLLGLAIGVFFVALGLSVIGDGWNWDKRHGSATTSGYVGHNSSTPPEGYTVEVTGGVGGSSMTQEEHDARYTEGTMTEHIPGDKPKIIRYTCDSKGNRTVEQLWKDHAELPSAKNLNVEPTK